MNSSPILAQTSRVAVAHRSVTWRLILWALIAIGSVYVLSHFLASRSEIFWVLVAPIAWLGSYGFQLFPAPHSRAKTKLGRAATVACLVLFPAAFYVFLVYATGSLWSWKEVTIAILFFAVALETVLIYLMQGLESITALLVARTNARWHIPLKGLMKLALYAALIPFLLVILSVHRPKLLPRVLHEIPSENRSQVKFLSRDGVTRLRGVFLSPPSPRGTVLVCHGVGANHADIVSISTILYDNRFQVVAFDFRGHGSSDGHTITYGWAERDDVLAAYDFCLAHPDVQPDRLYALGVSMGGATLIEALPEMPRVRAAVIDSAFATLRDMAEHQFRVFPKAIRPFLRQAARTMAWVEVGVDIESIRPIDSIAKTSIPLLLIHGTEDAVIPVENVRRLAAARSENLRVHIEPGAPHIGMAVLNPAQYTQLVRKQFAE
jgi:alpha-beta hydrolase superfamily lysophospholipase